MPSGGTTTGSPSQAARSNTFLDFQHKKNANTPSLCPHRLSPPSSRPNPASGLPRPPLFSPGLKQPSPPARRRDRLGFACRPCRWALTAGPRGLPGPPGAATKPAAPSRCALHFFPRSDRAAAALQDPRALGSRRRGRSVQLIPPALPAPFYSEGSFRSLPPGELPQVGTQYMAASLLFLF